MFTFSAASGQTLQQGVPHITVPINAIFQNWFQDPANNAHGSELVLTQPFTVQRDASAVIPQSVTLTNQISLATAPLPQ